MPLTTYTYRERQQHVEPQTQKERKTTMKRLMDNMKKMIERLVMAYVNCMNAYGNAILKGTPGAMA